MMRKRTEGKSESPVQSSEATHRRGPVEMHEVEPACARTVRHRGGSEHHLGGSACRASRSDTCDNLKPLIRV